MFLRTPERPARALVRRGSGVHHRRSVGVAVAGCLIAGVAAVAAVAVPAPVPSAAVEADIVIDRPTPGPLGAITLIGDSVLVGSGYEPSSLPTQLAQRGWGPIRFRAGLGYSAGNFQAPGSQRSAANWIRWWRQGGWDAPNVVVNVGNNDVGVCRTDVACNVRTIEHLMDAIGPGPTVWWSKITAIFTRAAEIDAYNAALDLVAAQRPNLRVWDWPAAQAANRVPMAWDFIHLPGLAAYRVRSTLMADDITARLGRAERIGVDAPLPVAAGTPGAYTPIDPARVRDTRTDGPGGSSIRLAAGGTTEIDLSSLVPAGTTAVAVNVTSVAPASAGFLTAFSCQDTRPFVSNGNYAAGADRNTFSLVGLGSARRLCVFTSAPSDVVVDLQGYVAASGSTFEPITPERAADTRDSGRRSRLEIVAPVGATAVAVTLTATEAAAGGFLTSDACGTAGVPPTSSLNFAAGETVSGATFVEVDGSGRFCVYASVDTDVVVDVTGVFRTTGGLRFVPAVSTRTIDTRDATGGWGPVLGARQTIDARVAPPDAVAVSGMLTMVQPAAPGFLTAFGTSGCATVPPTASVSAAASATLANAVTVGVAASGRLCVFGWVTTQAVFDTTGWWVP
jgi:hypothetical protein